MKHKIKKENVNLRFNFLTVIVYFIGIILLVRLFNLQIVHGAEYRENSNTRLSRESNLEATRGDILDRSGNTLATTTTTFNISLYKIKSDNESLNKCILNLTNLLSKYKASYPDNFPISTEKKYTIKGNERKEWLAKYKLEENTSEIDAIKYFIKKYEISTKKWDEIRKIIAIRYEITTKGYSSTKSLSISKNVPRDVVAQISEKNTDYPGVTISTDSQRKYNYDNLASHIVGYIGRINQDEYNKNKDTDNPYKNDDYIGKTGIEALFEDYLRGKDGKEEIEMSVDGTVTGSSVTENAIQGSTIVLTIDSKLQKVAEEALQKNINKIKNGGFGKSYKAEGGSVVVLDVKTGEVRAMASLPDYNPNSWVGGISSDEYKKIQKNNALFNKSISGSYSPGSIFKMATALAGLETGAITRKETINDTGIYSYGGQSYKCWHYTDYHSGHGPLNVEGAIQKSCNYFFYETAKRMGINNLVKYAKYFGFGSKTGIELPSETAGTLASKETSKKLGKTWVGGNTLIAAIGQGDNSFSPLQVAKYIAMVSNGGKKITPTIIRNILNSDGTEESKKSIRKYANKKLKLDITNEDAEISNENIKSILEGMKSVAQDAGGTAYNIFKNFQIEVGGKTGSAEAPGNKVNAWFAGFAPFDNPEICVVVMVENGGHGNYTAEVAKEIIEEYFGMNINSNEIHENNKAESYEESLN